MGNIFLARGWTLRRAPSYLSPRGERWYWRFEAGFRVLACVLFVPLALTAYWPWPESLLALAAPVLLALAWFNPGNLQRRVPNAARPFRKGPRGPAPHASTQALRLRLQHDHKRGKLQDPPHYYHWLTKTYPDINKGYARTAVYRELRATQQII